MFEKFSGLLLSIQKFPEGLWVCFCLCMCHSHRWSCSRSHPPCLGTDPSFLHEQEELSRDPRGRCFPSPTTSGEHLVSPSQDRETLCWRKHITYLIIFILLYFLFFSSSLPAPQTPPTLGLPALSPHSPLCQLPALVSVPSSFPSTLASRMQT